MFKKTSNILAEDYSSLFDFVLTLARVLDLADPRFRSHHLRVAYISLQLAEQLGLSQEQKRNIMCAGALHDVGGFYLSERCRLLSFEEDAPHHHAETGYLLLNMFPPFQKLAEYVRFHHVAWDNGNGAEFLGLPVPIESHILHLADRISVIAMFDPVPPAQIKTIRETIRKRAGSIFMPEFVDAFIELSEKEFFWLQLGSPVLEIVLANALPAIWLSGDPEELKQFAIMTSHIVDFKSRFTSTHTTGVANVVIALANHIGFSRAEKNALQIAAYFHDIGKLGVPSEILEKPGSLTPEEWHVMRGHVYNTYDILIHLKGLGEIVEWAALHHERMDGSGYPFHVPGDDVPLGARIMAVADVFTALTEDRPYRSAMPLEKVQQQMELLGKQGVLDQGIISILLNHFIEINDIRIVAQQQAAGEYEKFVQALEHPFRNPVK